MSYSTLDGRDGAFWPWSSGHPTDTPRIFVDKFPTKDGRARFIDVIDRPIAEPLDEEFPVYLTTGRILSQYQSGTQTRLVQELVDIEPTPFVEIHPGLAKRHELTDGDSVKIISRRGEVIGATRITNSIRLDTIFMSFHWSGAGRVNTVTNPALDPISGMPEFKICAVRLERVITATVGSEL
jgi:assimilatory nitrate reductase catalytic subunit